MGGLFILQIAMNRLLWYTLLAEGLYQLSSTMIPESSKHFKIRYCRAILLLALMAGIVGCLDTISPSPTLQAEPSGEHPQGETPTPPPSAIVAATLQPRATSTPTPTASPTASPTATATSTPRFYRWGDAEVDIADVDEVKLHNIKVGVNFLNGAVIPPGSNLSFDDAARSRDGREDDAYRMGWGTSCERGLVPMKGGGVCAVSTALWRATLEAGLETVRRKSHSGRIDTYNPPGLDATNTLIIANDSSATITVTAFLDGDILKIELIGDKPPDRVATTRGPFPIGELEYVVYQDIRFSDGSTITNTFYSSYCW